MVIQTVARVPLEVRRSFGT